MEKYLPGADCIVMTRDQVRAFDQWAINTLGIPGVVLMENAGRSCAELLEEKLAGLSEPKVSIFCGTGNNGGDGYVIARCLLNKGFNVKVVICGERAKIKGDAGTNLQILERLTGPVAEMKLDEENIKDVVLNFAADADIVVDAVFGTGLKGRLKETHKLLIESINKLGHPVLAVDIPSGLDCDTGRPLGDAIKAEYTVTFVAVKKGFVQNEQAARYTGEIFTASIGLDPKLR
jgi:NAD(P)H-hydrate epimerase